MSFQIHKKSFSWPCKKPSNYTLQAHICMVHHHFGSDSKYKIVKNLVMELKNVNPNVVIKIYIV